MREEINKIKNHAYLCYFLAVVGIGFGIFFYNLDPLLGIVVLLFSSLYLPFGYWIQKRQAFIPSLAVTLFYSFNTLSSFLLRAEAGYFRPSIIGLFILFFMLRGTYINYKYNFLTSFGEKGPRRYF